jgi:hypothetical protein
VSLLVPGTAAALERRLTPEQTPEERLRAGDGLAAFAERIGAPLAPHQAESLRLSKRTTAIVAPRQAGKSRAVSVLALERSIANTNHHTLIVSAGSAAAKRVLATIADMALSADPHGARLAREPTHELIEFTNGSTIRCVPSSPRRIRGWTIDLLVVDEAALVDDDLILSSAIPTTAARPNARIVLVSSPLLAVGAFYTFVSEGEHGSQHVHSARWSLEQSPWISQSTIDAARAALPPERFAAEYLGEFPESGSGLLIPRSWIRAAQERELPGSARGSYGVDVADEFGSDWTVIYRQRGGVVRLIERVQGQDTMQTADKVALLLKPTPAVPAIVDAIGVGAGVSARLVQLGVRVVPFKASHSAQDGKTFKNRRAEAYWKLREAFEQGRIDLDPDDRELADELALLRYDIGPTGKVQMESKDSMRARGIPSPDRADAVCMAVAAEPMDFTEPTGTPGSRRIPERKGQPSVPDRLRVKPGEGASLRKRPM